MVEATKSPIQNVVGSVFIHVTELRRSAEWYSMVMGLPMLEERLNVGPVYWLELDGGTGIILDDNRSNEPNAHHVLFSYKTADIEESWRYVETMGPQLLIPIERPHPGLAYFNFVDADGNAIMVTESDYASPVVERLPDTASPILNRIPAVFLNVTDMNRAIRFHSEVLGLPYDEVGPDESIYGLRTAAGSGLLLDNNRYRHGDDYHTLFMFATKDVDAAKSYLEANGVQMFTDIERHGEIRFFTVQDPDGNVVMICT